MDRLKAFIGLLVNWAVGPKQVLLYQGEVRHDSQTLRVSYSGIPEKLTVTSKQIVYHIQYRRKWIPDRKKSVFVVVCDIADEFRASMNPKLFVPQAFPVLCNPLLHNTEYPHAHAINAFMDQFFTTKTKV